MTTEEILKIVNETFDEEISASGAITILGLESYIDGKEEFLKKIAEKVKDKIS